MKLETVRNCLLLDKWVKGTWEIKEDLSVDVDGKLYILDYDGTVLPVKFNEIRGNVTISNCQLETIENFPKMITGDLVLARNKLKNLKDICSTIDGHLWLAEPLLESLEFLPEYINGNVYYQIYDGLENLFENIEQKFLEQNCKVTEDFIDLTTNRLIGYGNNNVDTKIIFVPTKMEDAPGLIGRSRINGDYISRIELQ